MRSTRPGSTPSGRSISKVSNFFFDELIPLAKRLKEEEKTFFPVDFDPNGQTYYVKRSKTTMLREDFETGASNLENLGEALRAMWSSQGYPELNILVPTISKLAQSLYLVEEENEEVSAFIYVMF